MTYELTCSSGSCGPCVSSDRKFFTKEEKVTMLREYKNALDKESQGVAERIAHLEKEDAE